VKIPIVRRSRFTNASGGKQETRLRPGVQRGYGGQGGEKSEKDMR
jgi:hypothetical protein